MFYSIKNAKILICAPSNSAIDEISIRLHNIGILDKDLNYFKPDFIRFGITDKGNGNGENKSLENLEQIETLKNHTLEKLVEKKFKEIDIKINQEIEKKLSKKKSIEQNCKGANQEKLESLKKQIVNLDMNIRMLKSERVSNISNKKLYEKELLEKTRILCTTLNSSGNSIFKSNNISFE
jgi:senataxin